MRCPASAAPVLPAPAAVPLSTTAEVEAACGGRYRAEVSDHGMGLTRGQMRATLLQWGYDVSLHVCREWLVRYRLGGGVVDGCAAVYAVSRQDVQRWYFVDEIGIREVQRRYRNLHGVYADHCNLPQLLCA